jgi:hypothetical protein
MLVSIAHDEALWRTHRRRLRAMHRPCLAEQALEPIGQRPAFCVFLTLSAFTTSSEGRHQAAAVDPLQPLAFLIGRWEGKSEGQPGAATVQREYTRVLNSRFIRAQNKSVYAPQDKNPKREVHEGFGVFSFDKSRRRAVLRQFHVEGFVNQYAADLNAQTGKIEFTSEAIENIASGWRARETYVVLGPDDFDEVFELAEPGKPFEVYSRARLKRVR